MSKLEAILSNQADVIVGIDPDVDRNGMAILYRKEREIILQAYKFPRLIKELANINSACKCSGGELKVYVEAGWLNKSNWHLPTVVSKEKASAMGVAVGRNQQVGHLIVECCQHEGIEVEEVKPLPKVWKGADKKITTEELVSQLKHHKVKWVNTKKINQEVRDAALIAISR